MRFNLGCPHVKLGRSLRAVSSMVEHFVYTEGVRSSSLLPPKGFRDQRYELSRNCPVMTGVSYCTFFLPIELVQLAKAADTVFGAKLQTTYVTRMLTHS